MGIIKSVATILIFLLALPVVGASAYDNGDFQIWNTDVEEVKVYKDVKFGMEQEYRYGEDATELYYQHYDWMAVFGFDKMLDMALGYRQVFERYKKKWRAEDMPNANATIKFDIWKFKFDDRNRLEYRHFRYKEDSIRYRNKFGLKLPIDIPRLKVKIAPYVSDEIFIVSSGAGFNENRLSAGAEVELTKYVKADIYYMRKENKVTDDKWLCSNVLGTKVKIVF
jgi:hypothetical protein